MATSGTVAALCISPANGSRLVCEKVTAKQSILSDCQHKDGWTSATAANIKNVGSHLLGDENLFVESLLCGVSVGDADVVREVVRGVQAPRLEEIWVTGDNVYVSGLDMSWNNFGAGDLLVTPGAAIVNSGYPHFACFKYAARAGTDPRAYINSEEGTALRLRGIKGAFLLPVAREASSATICTADAVRIVRRGTPEYERTLQAFRPPLEEGTRLVFQAGGREVAATAGDTKAYVDLLVFAGLEAGRLDAKRYQRTLPEVVKKALDLAAEGPRKPSTMEIAPAARSGDGTVRNVGIKTESALQCPECRQRFDTERARQCHWKFIHDPNRHQDD